jgi:predicted nucleotidyltransferase
LEESTEAVLVYNPNMVTQAIFQVPPINKRKRVPMKTIRALAQHIAEKFNPEQIILFGSHAYGKPTAWSDVDLLVVMDVPEGQEMETSLEIRRSLPLLTFGLDIVVRSRAVIERRKKLGDWFLIDITEMGKPLYERSHK